MENTPSQFDASGAVEIDVENQLSPPLETGADTETTEVPAQGDSFKSVPQPFSRRVIDFVVPLKRRQHRVPAKARALSSIQAHAKNDLIKLEVISRREIGLIRYIQLFSLVYNIVYLTTITCLGRYHWAADPRCSHLACDRSDFRVIVWFNFITGCIFTGGTLCYGVYFLHLYRLCASTRRPEVRWALLLLIPVAILSNNPALNIDRIQVLRTVKGKASSALAICRYGIVAYGVSAVTLYIVFKFGALERVKNLDEPYHVSFYVWRSIPLLVVFIAFFATATVLRIEFSPQPLVSLIALARAGSAGTKFSPGILSATIASGIIFILCVLGFLGRYIYVSRHVTRGNYIDSRLKVINVFFMFRHTFIPVLITMTVTSTCAALFPPSLTSIGSASSDFTELHVLDVPYYARSGIMLVYCVLVCTESFVMLPSSYRPTFLDRILIERLRLRALAMLSLRPEQHAGDEMNLARGPTSNEIHQSTILTRANLVRTFSPQIENHVPVERLSDIHIEASSYCLNHDRRRSQQGLIEDHDSLPPIVWKAASDKAGHHLAGTSFATSLRFDEVILAYNMSWLVYLSDTVIHAAATENANGIFSVHKIWREKVRDLVAMIFTSSEWVIVSFRGTVSLANMKLNLQILMSELSPREDPAWMTGRWVAPAWGYKHARIHTGFYDAYCSLRQEILPAIRELMQNHPDRRILICGHSLGGAMATQCAFDCRVILDVPEEQVTLITFGSPKVGNRSFARRFAVAVPDSFRLVNHSDFITNLPTSPFQIYDHVPRGVLIDTSGNVIIDPMFADLKLFHGNAALPHVLAAYKISLQAFVDHAYDDASATSHSDERVFEPDWWDFSKYERIDDTLMANTEIAVADIVSPSREEHGDRELSAATSSETDRAAYSGEQVTSNANTADRDVVVSDKLLVTMPDRKSASAADRENKDTSASVPGNNTSSKLISIAKASLTAGHLSTKLRLEKLDLLNLHVNQLQEFDGTASSLLKSPLLVDAAAAAFSPEPSNAHEGPNFTDSSIGRTHSRYVTGRPENHHLRTSSASSSAQRFSETKDRGVNRRSSAFSPRFIPLAKP